MSEPITYGAIENALVSLGFDVTVGPDYRLYRHAPTGTLMVTPDYPPEGPAEEMRLVTVRRMVVERGVARQDRLERLLRDSSSVPGAGTVKRSAVQITHDVPDEVKA